MNYSTRDGEMGYDFYFHSFYFPSHALDFSHLLNGKDSPSKL